MSKQFSQKQEETYAHWELLTTGSKLTGSKLIKHWECTDCLIKLFKNYTKNIGYVYNVSSKSIKLCNQVSRTVRTSSICKFFSIRLFYVAF